MTLEYKMRVVCGDDGGDGHCMTGVVYLVANKPVEQVNEVCKQAKKRVFDFTTLCKDYEDNTIPLSVVDDLILKGIDLSGFKDEVEYDFDEDEGLYYIYDGDALVEFCLCIMRAYDPELEIAIDSPPDELIALSGIGYGVFST